MLHSLRLCIVTLLGCSLTLFAQASADSAKSIDIPRGDLVTAFEAVARQTGAEVVYPIEQLKGQTTNGVSGHLSARQAVEKLLEGTPFRLSVDASGAMMITAPSDASPAAGCRS